MWGLQLLYADIDSDLGHRFLKRGLAFIERVERENRLQADFCVDAFPMNRAELLSTKALILGILRNQTDVVSWRQCGRDFLDWLRQVSDSPEQPPWHEDDQGQAYYLSAVRAELICGEPATALELLNNAPGVSWLHDEAELWRQLAESWVRREILEDRLRESLYAYFEIIRNPDYQSDVFERLTHMRPETGAILYKYDVAKGGEIDWRRVIEMVAA